MRMQSSGAPLRGASLAYTVLVGIIAAGAGPAATGFAPRTVNAFVDPDEPPRSGTVEPTANRREQYAKSARGWVDLEPRRGEVVLVSYLNLPDGNLAPGYIISRDGTVHFYQWAGVQIPEKDAPARQDWGGKGRRVVAEDPALRITQVEAPVQFLMVDASGTTLPGYYDFNNRSFYAFANVAVPIDQVPPPSVQHRCPLVPLRDEFGPIGRHTIPIPDHLKKLLAPWTHEPAASQAATTAPAAATTVPASETKNP